MGWLCQRIGLSVVVGFLAAGILVGPGMPYISLVSDVGRIETLAQVGLVFLMFSIGLRLSLRKLRRLGLPLLAAAFLGAIAMYYLSRLLAAALGWGATEGLFLAGVLMISSSAIIGKILHETGLNHERAGQLALGISVLEDVVAVVMLALLESVVQLGGSDARHASEMGTTLLHLGAFVAMIGIAGLILVPWLLKRMSISMDEELQTLGLAALLFGLAILAQKAGYSLALGAFLLGIIVAETPHRHQVERTFEGMRDVFSAVFFVAIGMQIDVRELLDSAGLIAGVAALHAPGAAARGHGRALHHRDPGPGRPPGGPDGVADRGVLLRHRAARGRGVRRPGPVLPARRRRLAPDDARDALRRQEVRGDHRGRSSGASRPGSATGFATTRTGWRGSCASASGAPSGS